MLSLFASKRAKIITFLTLGLVSILTISSLHPATSETLGRLASTKNPFHKDSDHPKWLVATMSPYFALSRRTIIRSTWQTLYRNSSTTEFKFVIANPDPDWEGVIAQENATYGDIIILRHLEENNEIANSIKTVEFFKYLTLNEEQQKKWTFVTKLDDDSYLDSKTFYDEWLRPMIAENSTTEELAKGVPQVNGIVIGKGLRKEGKKFIYPSGQFYTLSWDMATIMAEMQVAHNISTWEDVLVGELLELSQIPYRMVELPYTEAFEIQWGNTVTVDGKKTVWAEDSVNLDAWFHPVGPGSINPHRMKDDKGYMMVAACYGPDGARKPPPKEEVVS
jgi:hypothetical protein